MAPDQANYNGNYERTQKTVPVKSFQPNPWGLYQVHGDVWNWVEDCWNRNYDSAPADGWTWTTGDCRLRVLRGGAWREGPGDFRSAGRLWNGSWVRSNAGGFRVARTLNR
ncbi:MAG: formylglycine-generating enzyme family protein [Rhodomicrobium sp.]